MRSTVTASAATHATRSPGSTFTSCVSSTMNATAVNGERIVPPIIAPMLSAAQSPGSPVGVEGAERAPHNEERREHAAGRPRAEGHGPDHRLGHHEAEEGDADELPGEEVVDGVVADAQRTRV